MLAGSLAHQRVGVGRMKQGLSLRVSQHLALTPQLQQSIRLLQLSTLELSQEVDQMLDENPFLEMADEAIDHTLKLKALVESHVEATPSAPKPLDTHQPSQPHTLAS